MSGSRHELGQETKIIPDDVRERINSLSPAKRALLELKLKRSSAGTVLTAARDETVPLSYAQERFWFLDQLEPNSPAYNRPCAFRLKGALNMTALERTLNEIVRRHQVLRATFTTLEGAPLQRIKAVELLNVSIVDLSNLRSPELESRIQQLCAAEVQRPFDLVQGPLLRGTLFRLEEEQHILLLVMHHMVCDGWSANLFIKEMSVLYASFSAGKPSPLPETTIQYGDYAHWQQQQLLSRAWDQQLSYWLHKLSGAPALLNLPTDHPRPTVMTHQGAWHSLKLSSSLLLSLKALSRREGATLYMTLLAAFLVLLRRYTDQRDILVGSPILGRTRFETEELIGFFVNTLVLRTDLSGNPTFRELLSQVRSVALEAYSHQDLPFEKILEQLHLERNSSYTPLFQVMFNLENFHHAAAMTPSLSIEEFEFDSGLATFDLNLELVERGDGLTCSTTYSTDLFYASTIARMLDHYRMLLEGIVTNVDQRILFLPLLTSAERQLFLATHNAQEEHLEETCIQQLFEAQVERQPDALAVIFKEQRLTYRELNRRANQLAHYLRKLGVGPEMPVGICCSRSVEMLVAVLGVLKAGGAYLPLDPKYPAKRLRFMVDDAQLRLVLTQQPLASQLTQLAAQQVYLDSDWESIALESEENPQTLVGAGNLAYVIYTSGSTGKPKGVMVQHSSLVNYIEAATAEFAIRPSDRILQFASLSFDTAAEEIFPCLTRGATLIMSPGSMLDSMMSLIKKCRDWELTVLDLPTAYWHELVEQLGSEDLKFPASLRLVIIGGERAQPQKVATWFKHLSKLPQLMNTYGPTEATVVTTTCLLKAEPEMITGLREVPIGRAICNVQTYILDRQQQLVPVGIVGELYIGGVGLARGFLNRPKLTAEHFIPNPFTNEPGARLFRTGDLARYRTDGHLEFVGRVDHQVKLRGFRIELGEIESVLLRHPTVSQCVVTIQGENGDSRLIAYVTLQGPKSATVDELRRHVSRRLPDYMVPSTFVVLEALPMTPNGKVDRRTLSMPGQERPALENSFVAPRTHVEKRLAQIWCEVLGLKQVGVGDDFFKLGGHSLLAVRLFVEIEKRFGRSLPVASIFSASTVEQLAAKLAAPRSAPAGCIVVLREQGNRPPLFCVSRGALFSLRLMAHHLQIDQPVYGLQYPGSDGQQDPLTSIREIASEFLRHIHMVQPRGPYYLCGLCFGGLVAFEIAQQFLSQDQPVALLAMLDTFVPGFGKPRNKDRRDSDESGSSKVMGWMHRVREVNRRAGRSYRPQPYPGRLILLRPTERDWNADPLNGWGHIISGGIETYSIKGNHGRMFKEPAIRDLADQIGHCLLAAQTPTYPNRGSEGGSNIQEKTKVASQP